ncbi:MAG: transketolase [Rhodospirillaceae bacterium]|nr:transketolase [Rhodospirillaceae bacterium]|tara:strand:+ start:229 stop:2244 length:2016 start_codon:yes stop_codon:yes gene_type:complete
MTGSITPSDQYALHHRDMANAIRALSIDAVEAAKSGHPGMPLGAADIATVLYARFLKHDPAHPDWPDRDRFVLSAGHGSMLLYSLLYLCGYPDIDMDQIRNFRQLGSRTAGHPEFGAAAGIETTTGPLGQGLATAVGMAIAERLLADRFGNELVDHRTYVLAGDGDLMEGISHEAMSLAGHLHLGKLTVLYDSNEISIDGATSLAMSDDARHRAAALGWDTFDADGHDPAALSKTIKTANDTKKPALIVCHTKIGFGAPTKQGLESSHGAPLGEAEIAGTRKNLGWPHAPFTVPADILAYWRETGAAGSEQYAAWQERLDAAAARTQTEFRRITYGDLPVGWMKAINDFKRKLAAEQPKIASRVAGQKTLEVLTGIMPELIGGSADLSGSNGTRAAGMQAVSPENFSGNYIHYGVREHGMAAAMNGMALHGGCIPYGGTFLIFSDYCRPAIRLSALMEQRVIYVMTHDSIGLGEDGPTHQPVEHVASLRAMPNLKLFRPADSVETAECWQAALENRTGPSVLALSRQGLPAQRVEHCDENLSARGGYVLFEATGSAPKIILLATGSEVSLAVEARKKLQSEGYPTRVVSLPCWELFDAEDQNYRDEVLIPGTLRIAIEAAVPFGWERYLDANGIVIGMQNFGASAPASDLYAHFGITADAVVAAAREALAD